MLCLVLLMGSALAVAQQQRPSPGATGLPPRSPSPRRGLRWIIRWIEEQQDQRLRTIRFQKTELLSALRIARLLMLSARLVWIFLLLFALYVYLPIVFRFLPYTRQISGQIIEYTLTPVRVRCEMFLVKIPNLFFLLVISAIAY